MALVSELRSVSGHAGSGCAGRPVRAPSIFEYNLSGPRRARNFFTGGVTGFLALSALVALLAWGGWLHFGSVALSGRRS